MSGGTTVQTASSSPWGGYVGDPDYKGDKSWGQAPHLIKGFTGAEELLKGGLPDYYQGATLAGFDPAQTAAQQATMGYAMGPRTARMQQGAEGALGRSLSGYTGFNPQQTANLMAGNVDLGPRSPFRQMEGALTQGVMGNLQQNILPGIRQEIMGYQPGGGSRGNLVQNAAISKAVAGGLTKPMAQMYTDAYNKAQDMRMPAAGLGIQQQQFGQQQYPTIMGAPLSMYDAMGRVGAARRGMSQSAIDQDMQRYNYEQMSPYNALNQYMNTISGNYGGTTTQTTPQDNSGIMNMLGSLGSAAIMASDVRVKENLVRDGTIKGHAAYKFNYVGDDTPRRGVIAQEVEQTNPAAVAEFGGIKHVNYGAL